MKRTYNIDYNNQYGGIISTDTFNNLLNKMNYFKEGLDGHYGNKWAFTGSAAVMLYAKEYDPSLLENLDPPNDLDVLYDSEDLYIKTKILIDDYIRVQETFEKSVTFKNREDDEIDVKIAPVRKNIIMDLPIIDIHDLLEYYEDEYRETDKKKIDILRKIKDRVPRAKRVERPKQSLRISNFSRLDFGSDSENESENESSDYFSNFFGNLPSSPPHTP